MEERRGKEADICPALGFLFFCALQLVCAQLDWWGAGSSLGIIRCNEPFDLACHPRPTTAEVLLNMCNPQTLKIRDRGWSCEISDCGYECWVSCCLFKAHGSHICSDQHLWSHHPHRSSLHFLLKPQHAAFLSSVLTFGPIKPTSSRGRLFWFQTDLIE